MSDVEIIYITKEKPIRESMQPKVTIHNNFEIKQPEKIKNNLCKKIVSKKKNLKRRYAVFFIILIILIPALSVSYNAGYIPISQFLEIKEPIGDFKEITLPIIAEKYPVVKSIPELDKIKHKTYKTDEELSIVTKCYKIQIENEGYKLKYEGTENIEGFNVHYLGFIKGLTAIAILMTNDGIDTKETDTFVIYSTGSVFDYKQMFEKYSNYFDF